MKFACFVVLLCQISLAAQSQRTMLAPELQVKLAVLAAPEDKRDSATVFGFTDNTELKILRKGGNEFVCLADDPTLPGFSVACYHRDLEPFMERGRILRKEGKASQDIFNLREQEVKSGKLQMPKQPTTLFVYTADKNDYDSTKGQVRNGYLRSVIYIPYATAESTGLPIKPVAPGLPWLMNPGTHVAHVMISPPVVKDPKK